LGKTLVNVQVYGGVRIEKISILISCLQNCGGEMKIPLSLGNPIPQIPLMCFKCNSSYMVIEKFGPNSVWKKPSNKVIENLNTSLSKMVVEPIAREHMSGSLDISPTENQPWQDQSRGGSKILPSFINRWATVFVMIEEINEIANNTNNDVINLQELIVNFSNTSNKLNSSLRKLEEVHKIGRGERMSDAFPVREGPRNIAFRNIIGGNEKNGLNRNRGFLQEIGYIEFVNREQFRVNSKLEVCYSHLSILELKSPIKNYLDYIATDGLSADQKILGDYPKLITYYPEYLTKEIVEKIRSINPDEYFWMIHILKIIDDATSKDPIFGWDSNSYAFVRTKNCSDGDCHIRWIEKWEKYIQQANRKKISRVDGFAKNRLMTHINSTLGGLLGRMKELGLIYPNRNGLTKNFLISDLGKDILHRESEKNE